LTARSWWTFVVWLMISGCANQLAQPAANRLLANVVRPGRLGFAFGLKQSAPPGASMLAGLSVPLLAVTLGWRWAFGAAALLGLLVVVSARPQAPRPPRQRAERGRRRSRPAVLPRPVLLALTFAFGLTTAVNQSTTAFYVDSAVPAGTSAQVAGLLFAAGSLGAIMTRIVAGYACDRMHGGYLKLCATLIAIGCIGLGLLATNTPAAMGVGVLLALGFGWGFNGVFWFSLVRAFPKSPGALTGAVMPGGLIGGTVGPLGFGVVADVFGYPVMWTSVAVLAAAAAVAIFLVGNLVPDHAETDET
jgi:cyanate permease